MGFDSIGSAAQTTVRISGADDSRSQTSDFSDAPSGLIDSDTESDAMKATSISAMDMSGSTVNTATNWSLIPSSYYHS